MADDTTARRRRPELRSRAVPVAVWGVLVLLHLWASAGVGGPSVVFDEAGYLGNARWLAGGADWAMPHSPTYAVGYSAVLAPGLAVLDGAGAQWRWVLVVNAVLLASVFPLLRTVLTRVLRVPERPALAAAAVGALSPAVVAAGPSAISENLVLPLVVLSVLASWAMVRSADGRTRSWPYGYGLVVAALATTHPRFSAAVPVAAFALVVGWRARLVAPRVAVVNGGLLVLATAGGRRLATAVQDARWTSVEQLEGRPEDWLRLVRTSAGLREVALTAIGQAWYLAAGSLGLAVVAGLVLSRQALGRRSDADRAPTTASDRAARFAVGVLLVTAASVFATSVVFFARNQFRADHWVYGRHNDSFTPLWIAVALASLAAARRRSALLHLAAGTVVITVLGAVVTAKRDPTVFGSQFSPFAVPAIFRAVGDQPTDTFWRATAFALLGVALGAAVLVLRDLPSARTGHRPVVVSTVLVLGLAATSAYVGLGPVRATERYEGEITADWHVPEDLRRLGVDALAIDGLAARSVPMLTYPFHLPEVAVSTYDSTRDEQPDRPLAVARLDDPARATAGDRVVLLDEGGYYAFTGAPAGLAVWVAPGPEQDRAAEAGRLLPADFPTRLPEAARRAELRIDGADDALQAEPGGAAVVALTGRHTGSGAPWPDVASFSLPGRVAIQVRITADATDEVAFEAVVGELERWVLPGDRFRSEVSVPVVDGELRPLAPGRYRVRFDLVQVGEDWRIRGGPAATATLTVTG